MAEGAEGLFAGGALPAGPLFPLTNKSGGQDGRQRLFPCACRPVEEVGVAQQTAARRRGPPQHRKDAGVPRKAVKTAKHQSFSNRSTSVTMMVAPPTVTSTGRAV